MSRISNAFRLAKITPQANGLEMFVNGANEKLSECLRWLEFPFPLAYRRKELRGLDPSDYFTPMIYTTAREWFRLEPDDTCKAFSFWYSEDDKTSLNSRTIQKSCFDITNVHKSISNLFQNIYLSSSQDLSRCLLFMIFCTCTVLVFSEL